MFAQPSIASVLANKQIKTFCLKIEYDLAAVVFLGAPDYRYTKNSAFTVFNIPMKTQYILKNKQRS